MYPPRFDYLAPTSVEEVVEALGERAGDAKVMAGGQSLIPVLKLRIASVGTIVDVNRVAGLDGIEAGGGKLRIGALVRHADGSARRCSGAATRCSARRRGSWPTRSSRNLGTIGGSLAHADPAGDWLGDARARREAWS